MPWIIFHYGWSAFYYEHLCVNICISLESLFHPSSSNEIAHQIAFNACRFMSDNKEKREEYYTLIKKCYSYRSKIVHGVPITRIDAEKYHETIRNTYSFLCATLLKILSDEKLSNTFCDESKRKILFNQQLFG